MQIPRNQTLAEALYKDIDSNEYLNEIYESLLYNYSILIFKIQKQQKRVDVILQKFLEDNKLVGALPDVSFNNPDELGSGKELVDKVSGLIAIFQNPAIDFKSNRASGDDIIGDAYEYFMMKFAQESGKSKGQFYTPSEVSRIIARLIDPELIKIETTSYAYFFSSLNSFYESCLKKGLDIYFLYGEILTCFDTLLNEFSNIDKIYYNIIECGYGKSQEQKLNRFLKRKNVEVFSFYDHHLHSANKVLKEDNSHYKVFTHYYNKWMCSKKPEEQNIEYAKLSEIILSDFSKKDPIGKEKFIELRNLLNNDFSMFIGEENARECLADFMNAKLCSYNENREYPFLDGTSYLSHYLTTGQLSVREVFNAATMMPFSLGKEIFIKELAWRDFYNKIYYFHPNQHNEEIIEKYRCINWEYDEENFIKWKSGLTGFPIIDAAMRQLSEEGWMHNRLRMITASFLIKNLLIDWRLGEKYFSEMLIDYDIASNIGGWQWAASVGTDAVPYFRIFNPITQSKKYDPEGKFIKRYVKELKDIPTQYIHEPFKFKVKSIFVCKLPRT